MNSKNRLLYMLVATGCLAVCHTLLACDTPVFRYALEKWEPEEYKAFVFFEGTLGAEEAAAVSPLDRPSNLRVEQIETAGLRAGFDAGPYEFKGPSRDYRKSQAQIDAERKQVLAERVFHHRLALYNTFATGNSLPYVVVTFPPDKDERNRNEDQVLWEGEADAQTIASLVDSPARAEIGRRILAGDSAVWAVILCGDAEKDEACLDQLDKILQKAEEVVELSLPDSEAKISVNIPVKLDFSILRVDPKAPEESFFLKTLLKLRGKKQASPGGGGCCGPTSAPCVSSSTPCVGPVVIPFMGRGRAVEWIEGELINEDYIIELCKYISGPCSCEIKQQNPGMDMLFAIDWKGNLIPMIGEDEGPGELKGLGDMLRKEL